MPHILLRRLQRKRRPALTERRVTEALGLISGVVEGDDQIAALKATYIATRSVAGDRFWKDAPTARAFIQLARGLLQSRRMAWAHYVFSVGSTVENVNDGRLDDGEYASELAQVLMQLRARGETAGDGDDGDQADHDFARILDAKLDLLWTELDATDVGEVWRSRPTEYNELRERGRRYVHHRNRPAQALRDVVDESYAAATSAAKHRNSRAAVTLLGASLEGLFLLRCLNSKAKAMAVSRALPRRLRKRVGDDMMSWSFEILIEVCSRAGWLPFLLTETDAYDTKELAHSLRNMRNWIHPAREAVSHPWQGVFQPDYELAHALHTLVVTALRRPRARRGV
ncbi:MAG: hypothetical protein ACYC3L_16495 [Gemmatimonadaceae bacterium]